MVQADLFNLFAAVTLGVLAFGGGSLPQVIKNVHVRALSVLNMFASGIFFAGAILHLLRDAVQNEQLSMFGASGDSDDDEPNDFWAYVFFSVGFISMLLIEMFAHELERRFSVSSSDSTEMIRLDDATKSGEDDPTKSIEGAALVGTTTESADAAEDVERAAVTQTHSHVKGALGNTQIVAIVIFSALSFHSVMEGVAIGAQTAPAWNIFLAVAAHKALAAFALGSEFLSRGVESGRQLLFLFLFSIMTPIGIWAGQLTVSSSEPSASGGICTALSGGTFLFVAVMEIIPQELQNHQDQTLKGIALCLGFSIFGMMAKWV